MSLKIGNASFKEREEKGLKDTQMRQSMVNAQDLLRGKKYLAMEQLGNWETWRNHAEEIRQHVLENLDYYLNQFAQNVAKLGGHVYFSKSKEDAADYIKNVVQSKNAKRVIKSKSMVTEEISMNHVLEDIGVEVTESDLGEWILQVDDYNPPSHIVAPALHLNRYQIRDTFNNKLGYDGDEVPEHLGGFARRVLRQKFIDAEVGITGCNFAIADTGGVCIVTNEGNANMTANLPKTQIVVMGMERIVPSYDEVEVLVSMLTRSAVGQKLTSYINTFTGPRREGEIDGPEEFHVVIVDSGRSKILAQPDFRPILQCIRCAACINVCPVYRNIGGHAYGAIYPGPVGAVLTPLLGGYEDFKELPYASTLCGACSEACPVKIPLYEMIHKHRQVIVEQYGGAPFLEKASMGGVNFMFNNNKLWDMTGKMAGIGMNMISRNAEHHPDKFVKSGLGPVKAWTEADRDLAKPEYTSFRSWFKKRQKERDKELVEKE